MMAHHRKHPPKVSCHCFKWEVTIKGCGLKQGVSNLLVSGGPLRLVNVIEDFRELLFICLLYLVILTTLETKTAMFKNIY